MNRRSNPWLQSLLRGLFPGGFAGLVAGALAILSAGCETSVAPGAFAEKPRPTAPQLNPADPVLSDRRIYLFTNLDEYAARDVVARLHYLDRRSTEPIDLYLNTNGGPARYAFAIVDVIRSLRTPVNTWAVGDCRSAGAVILAAGTGLRTAYPHAIVSIHGGIEQGNVAADYLKLIQDRLDAYWRKTANLPEAWFPLRGNLLYNLTAEQAAAYDVIDEIVLVGGR